MTALTKSGLGRGLLGVPLFWKIVGANVIILALSAFLLSGVGASLAPVGLPYEYFVFIGLLLGGIANVVLVRLALEPIRELQRVAELVAKGGYSERGHASPQADPGVRHLIDTTNLMLDRISDDRVRLKQLAAAVVSAQQEERSDFARDLHDSVAQNLTAAALILASAAPKAGEAVAGTIREAQELIRAACEELRAVSRSLHPRDATDLGLPAALESLAKVMRNRSLIDVFIVTELDGSGVPGYLTPTLYWIASEALHGIEARGTANCATIGLTAKGGIIDLTIVDDGGPTLVVAGGTTDAAFKAARDRFSLAGGQVHIEGMADGGTRMTARITIDRKAA